MSAVAVIGSGPNGLAAAAVAARAGLDVTVYEANDTLGGAARTQPLDGSQARFDLGSAVHPMALQSPAMRELGVLDEVDFIIPELSFAHVLDDRTAYAWRDLERTAQELGASGELYSRLLSFLVQRMDELGDTLLNPLLKVPRTRRRWPPSAPAPWAAWDSRTCSPRSTNAPPRCTPAAPPTWPGIARPG